MHQNVHIFQFTPAAKYETKAHPDVSLPFSNTDFIIAN